MSFFGNNPIKEQLILELKDAIRALENNEIVVVEPIIKASAGLAFSLGFTKRPEASVYGWAYVAEEKNKRVQLNAQPTPKPMIANTTNTVSSGGFVLPVMSQKKLSDREAEMYKVGITYTCRDLKNPNTAPDCGFESSSITGFKRHFHNCPKRQRS